MTKDEFLDLRHKVNEEAPNFLPPPQHWLVEEPAESYCYKCATLAAFSALVWGGTQNPSERPDEASPDDGVDPEKWWDEATDAMIDGGAWYSATAEEQVNCNWCGKILHYWLIHGGLSEELNAYAENPGFMTEPDQQAYALDRMFEAAGDDDRDEVAALANRWLESLTTSNHVAA